MPKRSQEYRDARRQHILDAAKRCFVRNGFHETSMQDLFAEADLSAGAVYGYFASKDDVILAIAEENIHDVVSLIRTFAADPHQDGIGATLAAVVDLIRTKNREDALGALALFVWTEVLRNPALNDRFTTALTELRAEMAAVVAEHQGQGTLPADVSADGIAGVLLALVPGVILQMTLLGDASLADFGAAARALWPKDRPGAG
jgi:AcrR family transcriptional regulator